VRVPTGLVLSFAGGHSSPRDLGRPDPSKVGQKCNDNLVGTASTEKSNVREKISIEVAENGG